MRRSASPCFCINLRRAAGAVSDFYDRALSEAQLTTSQFSLMRNLRRLQPCTVTALAKEMGLERTTLVRTMKPLSERGLIADLAEAKSCNSLLSLTEDGIAVMSRAAELWEGAQSSVRAHMGEEKMSDLLRLLNELEEFAAQ